MSDERAFLDQLLAGPGDNTARLVYADWLDETLGPAAADRSAFLRLVAEFPGAGKKRRKAIETRLRELAAGLDTDWLAVVSKLPIENCPAGGTSVARYSLPTVEFEYECPKRWEHLAATDEDGVRFCAACQKNVYYCDTIPAAREHAAQGHCVAVDVGLPRRPGDLEPRLHFLGRVSTDFLRREDERLRPDPVSEARERRKRDRVG